MGPGPGTLPNQEIKRPCNQCWIYHLVCVFPSLFQVSWVLFHLCLKHVGHLASSQPHCCMCPLLRGDKVLPLGHKTVNTANSLCWSLWDPQAMRDQHPLLKLVLFCLFSTWVKHCSIRCLTALGLPRLLRCQKEMGRRVYRVFPW